MAIPAPADSREPTESTASDPRNELEQRHQAVLNELVLRMQPGIAAANYWRNMDPKSSISMPDSAGGEAATTATPDATLDFSAYTADQLAHIGSVCLARAAALRTPITPVEAVEAFVRCARPELTELGQLWAAAAALVRFGRWHQEQIVGPLVEIGVALGMPVLLAELTVGLGVAEALKAREAP